MDANTKKLRDNYLDWALSHSSDGVRIYEKSRIVFALNRILPLAS